MEAERLTPRPDAPARAAADASDALPPRSELFALCAVALVALGLRVAVALRTHVIFDDGPAFVSIARAMARGDFGSALAHPFHPLYPMLVWLSPGSAGREELFGVAWSIAAGVACVLLVAWLVRPLFGARVAVTAAALLAINPYAVRFAADVQSDTVHLALFLLGLGLVQRAAARADAGLAFAAGIATALAYLTRPEGVGVLVVGVALVAGQGALGRLSGRRVLALGAALVGGFSLLAVPYMRIIWVLSGEWQLTQKKSLSTLLGVGYIDAEAATWIAAASLCGALALAAVFARRPRIGGAGAWLAPERGRAALVTVACVALGAALVASPGAVVRWTALFVSTLRPEIAILLVAGVVAAARARPLPSGRSLFFATVFVVHGTATFALLVTEGYLSRRHLLPLAVVLLGYAAYGLLAIAAAIARARPSLDRRRAALALVLVVVAIALPKTLRAHRQEGVAARIAAEWVRDLAAPGDRLATERPRTAYYAGLVFVPIHDERGLLDGQALRSRGVRWVIAGKRELAEPGGHTLAVEPAPGQRFELVHEAERHGFRALVFEVHEPGQPPPSGGGPD